MAGVLFRLFYVIGPHGAAYHYGAGTFVHVFPGLDIPVSLLVEAACAALVDVPWYMRTRWSSGEKK